MDTVCKTCGAPISANNPAAICDHGADPTPAPEAPAPPAPEAPAPPALVAHSAPQLSPGQAIASKSIEVDPPADPKAAIKSGLLKAGYPEAEAEQMASDAVEKAQAKA